jgi:hypothetical protein
MPFCSGRKLALVKEDLCFILPYLSTGFNVAASLLSSCICAKGSSLHNPRL